MLKTLSIIAAAVLISVGSLQAQVDLSKWSIGSFPSILQYQNGDDTELFKLSQSTLAIDLGVGYRLNPSLLVEGHFMGGNLDFENETTEEKLLETDVFDLTAQLQYRFDNGYILKEDARVAPFIFAGAGVIRSQEGTGAVIPLGAGVNFRLDDIFSIQWRSAYKYATLDEYNMYQHSIGFVFHLGSKGEQEEADMANDEPKDSDGDGIADMVDKCPDVPGVQANNGCPELDMETRQILAVALEGIQFQTGKDVLKDESYPILDRVVTIMNKHPEYNMVIEGHTDSSGDDAMNLDLSKRRAKRAMEYLVEKGIDQQRLTYEGYGETKPVADNTTPEGRAKNRRVEFRITF